MRFSYTIMLSLSMPLVATAQEINGRVLTSGLREPIEHVIVVNKSTLDVTATDSLGYYTITGFTGDTVLFYRLGYTTSRHLISGNNKVTILKPVDTTLDEVVIRARNYKLDSTERAVIYGRGLREARKKVYVRPIAGAIIFYNLPSQLAKRITGRLKREKRFLRQFEEGEKEKFIVTRYNMSIVSKITGLQGDDVAHFMNAYPMAHDYARTASDLELYTWIKDNYRQYQNKEKRKP